LGDPARLLNDLADEGLDFAAILGDPTPVPSATLVGNLNHASSPSEEEDADEEEVNDDD
jgi:hypothetical protein